VPRQQRAGAGGGDDDAAAEVATEEVRSTPSRIQCMVVSPRSYLDDEDDDDGDDDEGEDGGEGEDGLDGGGRKDVAASSGGGSNKAAGSATFLSLQLYARHCFVPAVRAIEALEEEEEDDDDFEEKKEGGGGDGAVLEGGGASKGGGGGGGSRSARMLEGLEDRLRELDVALGQCRSSALMGRIPHVVLRAHPVVASAAANRPDSTSIDVDASGLSLYLNDDAFLNEVQATLNHWIVQIRKVTTLPLTTPFPPITDPDSSPSSSSSSGKGGGQPPADLEEVSFWLGLEEALRHVRSELDKPSVTLTVALLRSAKRFVATIALDNNTGLVEATSHATDVANFLRGYPAQSLASAGDWDRIGSALDAIFAHLPKVRQSRYYDLDRLARLVEASTRVPTQDLFVLFDARYAEFSEFFLDQGRMRRRAGGLGAAASETPAQVLKGIRLHHVGLRERLDAVHYFRTQHEKLRSVVAEVLTGDEDGGDGGPAVDPASSPSTAATSPGGEDYSAWALREVDEAPVSLFASVDVLDLSPRGEALFASALEGYDRKVDAIEEHLARLLRDKLSSCQVSRLLVCAL